MAADGKGYFRFDRVRDAKKGGKERQVYVEMLGMTDEQAGDVASQILTDVGYNPGRRWNDENGTRIRFFDNGKVPIDVLVRSREVHSGLDHADSTSSVYLTRPIEGQ